jgi:hypothetical protein
MKTGRLKIAGYRTFSAGKYLSVIALLSIISFIFPIASSSADTPAGYYYSLDMNNVDTVEGASRYDTTAGGNGRPALIGFKKSWSASKRLPFKIGPGRVRVYTSQIMSGRDKKQIVTIGGQTREVLLSKELSQYHLAELVFDLEEATDQVSFRSENIGGVEGQMIWYNTIFTNDPDWKYIQREKNKWQLFHQPAIPSNLEGNLVPNSGFEEGITGWDVTPYRSCVMMKPSLLNAKAAHGNYSLDAGRMPFSSRWFVLKGELKYALSLYICEDNPVPISVRVESRTLDDNVQKIAEFNTTDATASSVKGWKRLVVGFGTLPDEQVFNGHYRLAFEKVKMTDNEMKDLKESGNADKPLLIDSVQIVEGNDKPYAPFGGMEANFISPVTQGIFNIGEPSRIQFNLYKKNGVDLKKCSFTVYDYFDRVVQGTRNIDCDKSKGSFQKEIPFNTGRAGFFRVRTQMEYTCDGQSKSRWNDFFYNVVHPVKPCENRRERSLLGAYYVKAPEGPYSYADIARRFGFFEFNTLGHQLMRWSANISKGATAEKPEYDWNSADREIEAFRSAGISITVTLHVANGSYQPPKIFQLPKDAKEDFFQLNGTRHKGEKFKASAWLDYVRQFASRYKGKISKYVIEDEPRYYFSNEEYARFYLATRKAIKEVDPAVPVFFDAYIADISMIKALDAITDNKAHEYMDGIHAYLDSNHSGLVSKKAALEFRKWIQAHKMSLVTATCYSNACRHDDENLTGIPFQDPERDSEARSVQYLLDGVIWGQSNCFYYYYGVHPGWANGGTIFDDLGRVKPVFHFYSAANHLIGGFTKTESVDDFENFRIGLIETAPNKGAMLIYSVDGKIYDFKLKGAGVASVLDGFGNPVDGWKQEDWVSYYVSQHPLYLLLDDLDAVRKNLGAIQFKEKLPVNVVCSKSQEGIVRAKISISSNAPLSAEMETAANIFNPDKKRKVSFVKISDTSYSLEIQMLEIPKTLRLRLATNFGDLSAEYPVTTE